MGAITDDQGVITEQVAAGFTLTDITCLDGGSLPVNVPAVDLGARSVTLTPVADEDITCNFMNTKVGSISIAKNAVLDADHTFNFTGPNGAFTINDNNADESVHVAAAPFNGLGPGTYSFTETDANAAPYTLTGIACNSSGGFPSTFKYLGAASGTDNFELGDEEVEVTFLLDDVVCTFTNTARAPDDDRQGRGPGSGDRLHLCAQLRQWHRFHTR